MAKNAKLSVLAILCFLLKKKNGTITYKQSETALKLTSYSNFLKSDQYYDDIILQSFDNLDDYDMDKIKQLMKIFT